MSATLGRVLEDSAMLAIGDSERRSGLYILGKPRMGKSWLVVNLIAQDIANGHGVFFLAPHGDAIDDLLTRYPLTDCLLFDPEDEEHSFGINPLQCDDLENSRARSNTYTRVKGIFDKLWKNTFEEKPWLQMILQNTIYTFIENQEYTLADFPLFFRDQEFRYYLFSKMRYNRHVLEYWLFTFVKKNRRDQDAQMEAAQTRAEIMLAHPYVRDIVGQSKTTIDFAKIMEENKVIFIRLSSHLSNEDKKIIGTLLISELKHAIERRQTRNQFCIFVDEFQNFASFDDFSTLITQAPKYGIATTIAHHERYGQLEEDPKILGATAAIANKVLFQITPGDAKELAPEFAEAPPTESRREPELVISQQPVAELLRGHKNPDIRALVNQYLRPLHEEKEDIHDDMEFEKLIAQDMREEAALSRLEAQSDRMYRGYAATERALGALAKAEESIYGVRGRIETLLQLFQSGKGLRWLFRALNKFLSSVMQGEVCPKQEEFKEFLIAYAHCSPHIDKTLRRELELYIALSWGDQTQPRTIPVDIMREAGVFHSDIAIFTPRLEAWKNWEKDRDTRNDQNVYNVASLEHKWSAYAIAIDYILLINYPPLWQMMHPYLSARFDRKHTDYENRRGKDLYAEVVVKCKQHELDSLIGFIEKYKEGAFVVFALLAAARHRNRDMMIFKKLTNDRMFDLIMPDDKSIGINPIIEQINETILTMPDQISPGILKGSDAEAILRVCKERLSRTNALAAIDDFVQLCEVLSKPENHILVPSGQYLWKEINTRSEADMSGEVVRELASLIKYTAYSKILLDGGSTIWRGKIQTRKLEPQKLIKEMPAETRRAIARYQTVEFVKKRKVIEDEIRHRQGAWPGAGARTESPAENTVKEQSGVAMGSLGQPEEPPPQEA